MAYLGAHESVAGGLHLAFERVAAVGGEALQIFTRNQRQWQPPPLTVAEREYFIGEWKNAAGIEVVSHSSYLINLATAKPDLLEKSIVSLVLELERCRQLGIQKVVLHPGSHGGDGIEQGLRRFVRGLDAVFERASSDVQVLIETTAGQGTGLGAGFEELGAIIASSRYPQRIGVCLDTCHIFAAGYDLRSREAYEETMLEFDRSIGFGKLELIHLNDSKKELGTRVDRHDHIGEGCIGDEAFRMLVKDGRLAHLSMILETPKQPDLEDDRKNLKRLRSLML